MHWLLSLENFLVTHFLDTWVTWPHPSGFLRASASVRAWRWASQWLILAKSEGWRRGVVSTFWIVAAGTFCENCYVDMSKSSQTSWLSSSWTSKAARDHGDHGPWSLWCLAASKFAVKFTIKYHYHTSRVYRTIAFLYNAVILTQTLTSMGVSRSAPGKSTLKILKWWNKLLVDVQKKINQRWSQIKCNLVVCSELWLDLQSRLILFLTGQCSWTPRVISHPFSLFSKPQPIMLRCTGSLSHSRTMLPESSSCPQLAQRPNHAT